MVITASIFLVTPIEVWLIHWPLSWPNQILMAKDTFQMKALFIPTEMELGFYS